MLIFNMWNILTFKLTRMLRKLQFIWLKWYIATCLVCLSDMLTVRWWWCLVWWEWWGWEWWRACGSDCAWAPFQNLPGDHQVCWQVMRRICADYSATGPWYFVTRHMYTVALTADPWCDLQCCPPPRTCEKLDSLCHLYKQNPSTICPKM